MNAQELIGSDELYKRMAPGTNTCKKCGAVLWDYFGEYKREWDIQWFEWVESIPGRTLDCGNCRQRLSLLFDICGEVRIAAWRVDQPAPDGISRDVYRHRLEKYQRHLDAVRKKFNDRCQEWGFYPAQVHEKFQSWTEAKRYADG